MYAGGKQIHLTEIKDAAFYRIQGGSNLSKDSKIRGSLNEMFGMIAGMVGAMGATIVLTFALIVLYYTIMETSKFQATVGKLAVGLKVTDVNGEKLDFTKALVRNLCKIISSMILFIGYIMAGFTEKKQGLHDIIAGTLVVKK